MMPPLDGLLFAAGSVAVLLIALLTTPRNNR